MGIGNSHHFDLHGAPLDDREVETHPGDRFAIEFDAERQSPRGGSESGDTRRTFFFAGQGYYVEWLRPAWMKNGDAAAPFSPANTSIRDLLRSWKGGRDSLEAHFFWRVPVA